MSHCSTRRACQSFCSRWRLLSSTENWKLSAPPAGLKEKGWEWTGMDSFISADSQTDQQHAPHLYKSIECHISSSQFGDLRSVAILGRHHIRDLGHVVTPTADTHPPTTPTPLPLTELYPAAGSQVGPYSYPVVAPACAASAELQTPRQS